MSLLVDFSKIILLPNLLLEELHLLRLAIDKHILVITILLRPHLLILLLSSAISIILIIAILLVHEIRIKPLQLLILLFDSITNHLLYLKEINLLD